MLLRVPEDHIAVMSYPLAQEALATLLERVDTHDHNNLSAFYFRHIIPSTYLKLDSAAIDALNLVSKKPEPKGTLPLSIFTWLNRCHTGMGSRAMHQWLLQPLRDVDGINERLTMVEVFLENPVLRDSFITTVLKRCSDMDRLNRKLQRRSLPLKDTQAILNFVELIPDAINVLTTFKGQQAKLVVDEYIAPLKDIAEHLDNLKILIESTVDFTDKAATRMNAQFDDDLQELYVQLAQIQKQINKEYSNVLSTYEWNEKQLKYEYHPSYGYVFRVSRKEDRQLRANKELITVSTAKDGVRFTTEKMSSISEQYKGVSAEYDQRQQELKKKLVDTIASYLPVLDDAKEILAKLDVYVAWAQVVKDSPRPMTKPSVHADSSSGPLLELTNVRHPLVELRRPNYMANSVHLTSDVNGLIITGPNMGGKSTFMRSVAVAVVLAQAGCFVPADAAKICVRDAVMCRVGATDHLAQGVSTFMVEMLESSSILTGATPQTLAVIDELGRGTSTYDGFGLAWAIAKEIGEKIQSTMLFSTHFHELTQLPQVCSRLTNVHFGANVDEAANTLQFSYKLEPGPCGRSFGIYVAALANLPTAVVDNARKRAQELESSESLKQIPHEEMVSRMAAYAKRVRDAEGSSAEERKRLKMELQADAQLLSVLGE
ncbi:MutS domain III/MutS family domain IV/MutS domain V, putative [Angomonas deanei]|uniref:MutS domain III/MutS family domain IV/MutS domain V, putative n=1 Tax=Angomonas deanei TaxID=59799 RepID=A0A7G2CFN1_9TRYP|nr:MutS domain III/MutS family domain IV/MutS domain V, putative [Angomonas deanei]